MHFSYSVTFFENCAFYDIMWKIIVEPDRPQMAVWRLRIVCWMTKAAHTHTHTHKV